MNNKFTVKKVLGWCPNYWTHLLAQHFMVLARTLKTDKFSVCSALHKNMRCVLVEETNIFIRDPGKNHPVRLHDCSKPTWQHQRSSPERSGGKQVLFWGNWTAIYLCLWLQLQNKNLSVGDILSVLASLDVSDRSIRSLYIHWQWVIHFILCCFQLFSTVVRLSTSWVLWYYYQF